MQSERYRNEDLLLQKTKQIVLQTEMKMDKNII